MRRVSELALCLALVACGAGAAPGCPAGGACDATGSPVSAREPVAFRDLGAAPVAGRHDPTPAVEAAREGAGLRITVYMGEQRTGGYAIRVEQVTRVGDRLEVRARFSEPPPGSLTSQVITSPAHTIAVDTIAATVVLLDEAGTERARTSSH